MVEIPNFRRQFLQSLASGLVIAGVDFPQETRKLYSSPPPDLSPVKIDIRHTTSPQVLPNEWVAHQFGWQTEGEEGPEALDTVRSAVNGAFQLNETEVEDFQEGWRDIEELATGQYQQKWRYVIPPLPLGEHVYSVELTFNNPIRTPGNQERIWEGTYRFEGSYTVTSNSSSSVPNTNRTRNKRTSVPFGEMESITIDEHEFLSE